jgi:hypothetical protein
MRPESPHTISSMNIVSLFMKVAIARSTPYMANPKSIMTLSRALPL